MRKALNLFMFLPLVLFMYSCGAPAFVIKSLDDKFADSKQPYGTVGENNRISTKSSQGGVHIDEKGVYIDPFLFKNRETNQIVTVGFYVNHFNSGISAGFNPIEEIIFLTDSGARISLKIENKGFDFDIGTWNTITSSYNSNFSEGGVAIISLNDFLLLKDAIWIEAKIIGKDREVIYERDDIANSFLINLKNFYTTSVK